MRDQTIRSYIRHFFSRTQFFGIIGAPLLMRAFLLAAGCHSGGDTSGGTVQPPPPPPPPPPADPVVLSMLLVADGFESPVLLTAPDGDTERLFVVEQTGRIKIIRKGEVLATPFLDLSFDITVGEETGLFGFAFDPDYANNGRFFVSYTNLAGNSEIRRYSVSADPDIAGLSSELIIEIPQPDSYHNGGMIAFGPDGYLHVGLGDGNWGDGSGDPAGHGQNKGTLLGGLLRIDVSAGAAYTVPADNPFVGEAGSRGELWAYGLRNPWRFSFDRDTGDLYIGDVGHEAPEAREEINVAVAPNAGKGLNYGWNRMQGTQCFNPAAGCDTTGITAPLLEYPHPAIPTGICSGSVTGGYVYRGEDIADFDGTYLYGDFCSGWVRSFRYVAGAATDAKDRDDLEVAGGIRNFISFGEDARGELYALSSQGEVFRIAQGLFGAAGGTARSADGNAAITVPAGALGAGVAITIDEDPAPPGDAIGKGYDFGPDGTTFSTAATITIGYDPDTLPGGDESNLTLGRYNGSDWMPVAGATLDAVQNRVSGPVTGFSVYAVIPVPPGSGNLLTLEITSPHNGDGVVIYAPEARGCSTQSEDGPICVREFAVNSTVTLEANPYSAPLSGVVWTGCDTVNVEFCTVLMNADRTVQVHW